MEPKKPKFNSKSLQEAYQSASGPIDGVEANLDKVSEDIKSMELYLQQTPVRQMETVTFFGFPMTMMHQDIMWMEDPKSKKWRIMLMAVWPEKKLDPESQTYKTVPNSNSRPLIECPAQTRLMAYPFLGELLKKVGASVTVNDRPDIPKA